MNISVQVIAQSPSKVAFNIITPDGSKKICLLKSDFQLDPEDYEIALIAVLKNFAKESGLTTWVQRKTAIEGKVFKI
ncbi:MAG: hypothetical protein HZA08_04870 [Nitrospirae bacterium]|nr:hypothetical protein [Nitrospirota bacterium]